MPRIAARTSRTAGQHYLPDEAGAAVPARALNEATQFTVSLDLSNADLDDSTLNIIFALEGSTDGGATWILLVSNEPDGWYGGMRSRTGARVPPRLNWSASDNRLLNRARLRWTQSRAASVGAFLDMVRIDRPQA